MTRDLFASTGRDLFASEKESPKDFALPNLEATEEKIAGREDLLGKFLGRVGDSFKIGNRDIDTTPGPLQALGGVAQRGESLIANLMLASQRGSGKDLIGDAMKGATGERLGQVGDVVRTTGYGGEWNEALASSAGFMATLGMDKILSGGRAIKSADKAIGKAASVVPETLDATAQAAKDAITNKTGFLDDVRSAFYDAKGEAVEKYGEGLEMLAKNNPKKTVSIRPVVDQLNQDIAHEPKLRSAIDRVPRLASFLNTPSASNKLNIIEVQKIVNDLQSRVTTNKLKGVGVRPDDIPLLDAIHDIKAAMVQAFPDIADLRKGYGEALGAFNLVRTKLKPGNLAKAVQSNFGDVEIEEAAKKLLEKHPEIISRMKNYNSLRKVGGLVKKGATIGAKAELLRRVVGS